MNTKKHTNVLHQKMIGSACVTSVLFSLVACGGGGGGGDVAEAVADFDGEVYSQTNWSTLSPSTETGKEFLGTSDAFSEIVETNEYSCTSDSYNLTETPKEFVAIDPDASIMWLGNLIQGDSHLQVGSLAELAIRERAPMNISINLLRGDNFRIIDDPSLLSVNGAIGELIEAAVAAGHEASSDAYFVSKEAHSTEQTSLEFGFTAEYLGASAEARLSVEKQGEENTFFAYFIQNAFTVSMELPTAPHDMVSDAFTQSQLDDLLDQGDLGETNPPLYISSMSYGRVLIYKMTSTHSKERIQAAINASYNGLAGSGSGYSEIELQETLSSAKIEISAFGGNQSNIDALIRSGNLSEYFSKDTKLSSMKPISFEIRNLQDNTIAKISRTTKYDVKQCMYVGKTTPPIGETIRVIFEKAYIKADCDAGIDKGDIYGRFDVISYDNENQSRITRRVHTISSANPVKVQSGNDLGINRAIEINKYYGRPFEISAQLKDKDGGANGADDLVGNWNANSFSIAYQGPGSYSKKAVSNCNGSSNNPTLYYRLERVGFLD